MTSSFLSPEKKRVFAKQVTGQMDKPGNAGDEDCFQNIPGLPKPNNVMGNAKREKGVGRGVGKYRQAAQPLGKANLKTDWS